MEQEQIEKYLKKGKYKAALAGLTQHKASAWRDTTELRCLRSQGGGKRALSLANRLNKQLNDKTSPYGTTLSERNHLRRYIALVFAERGEAEQAATLLRALVKASPDIAALRREFAFALTNNGQLDLAENELRRSLNLQPANATSQAQLARLYCRSARIQAGYDGYQRAASLEPSNSNYLQRLVYWSNYLPQTTQQSNYQLSRLWSSALPKPSQPRTFELHDKNLDRKLKVGLISANFRAHSSSFFIKPLLRNLERKEFSITAYHTAPRGDAVTEQIKSLAGSWVECTKLSDQEISERIIADNIDILLDLDGHSSGNKLNIFANRCAPIQIAWLGNPSTSGVSNIDYRITDRAADPVGLNDQFHTETLLRLPNGFLCYEPLSNTPDVTPSLNEKQFRFGSFNCPEKISTLTLDSWCAALHSVPNSTISVKHKRLQSTHAREHLIKGLLDRGIDQDRVQILDSDSTIEKHLERYNQIDLALDTTPYNGKTTTLEALWMGVPVLSLAGQTHCSRISRSILSQLHLKHLATETIHEFAKQAKKMAGDRESLAELKSQLRTKLLNSNLLNSKQFGRNFGFTLRQQWREWASEKMTPITNNKKIREGVVK